MRTLILTSALLLGACSSIPHLDLPKPPVASAYPLIDGGGAAEIPAARDLAWRRVYGDPRLAALIAVALDENRDLRTALLNVEAARAERRIARGALMPALDAEISSTRERSALQGDVKSHAANLSLTAFELDVFGRLRAQSKAAFERYLATEEGGRAARISLISAVASAYLDERLAQEQEALTRATLADWSASLEIVRRQRAASQSSGLELAQAEGLVRQAEADLEARRRELIQATNALTLVVGAPISAALPAPIPLMDQPMPTQLSPGLPSDLLVLRPDIVAAEHALRASNADVGAARAAFLPQISLTGALGVASPELSRLFSGDNKTWSFTPRIVQPILRGEAPGGLDLAKARRALAVAAYEKQIQVAFKEVSDGLAAQLTYSRQVFVQEAVADSAANRRRLSNLRYEAGVDGRLELLDAQRGEYAARQALLSLKRDQLVAMASLYAALGGGPDGRS